MSYKAKILNNTGFNAVNIPVDRATIIAAAKSSRECDLDITQNKFLSYIEVPFTFSQVEEADYVLIWDESKTINESFCYFVTNIWMDAKDVVNLTVVPDYLTSIGGPAAIQIIDGITTRSTYALGQVSAYELEANDPYLAPADQMIIVSEWIGDGDDYADYIESTIDVVATAQLDEGVTVSTGAGEVTYPVPQYADPARMSYYRLDDYNDPNTPIPSKTIKSPGSMLFMYDNTTTGLNDLITKGLAKIRGMGLESAILNSVRIPKAYAEATNIYDQTTTLPDGTTLRHVYVIDMEGKWTYYTSPSIHLDYITRAQQQSDRAYNVLNYTNYSSVGMITAAGNKLEVDPKDLKSVSDVVIKRFGDPRPEGRPYFRFQWLNDTANNSQAFFRDCITGLPWKNVPLVFSQASGNLMNTVEYTASRTLADVGKTNRKYMLDHTTGMIQTEAGVAAGQAKYSGLMGVLGSITGANLNTSAFDSSSRMQQLYEEGESGVYTPTGMYQEGTTAANPVGLGLAGAGVALSVANNIYNWKLGEAEAERAASNQIANLQANNLVAERVYQGQKLADMLSYGIAQDVNVPTVMFPYNAETIRDFYGNGVLLYQKQYTARDIQRLHRIVNAYGVKYTMKSEAQHFIPYQGDNFCYVEAVGVTLADLPRWLSDGAATQLANGVRIWNTRPVPIS